MRVLSLRTSLGDGRVARRDYARTQLWPYRAILVQGLMQDGLPGSVLRLDPQFRPQFRNPSVQYFSSPRSSFRMSRQLEVTHGVGRALQANHGLPDRPCQLSALAVREAVFFGGVEICFVGLGWLLARPNARVQERIDNSQRKFIGMRPNGNLEERNTGLVTARKVNHRMAEELDLGVGIV